MKEISEEEKYLNEYAKLSKEQILLNNFLYKKLEYLADYNKITKKILEELFSKHNKEPISILENYKKIWRVIKVLELNPLNPWLKTIRTLISSVLVATIYLRMAKFSKLTQVSYQFLPLLMM